MNKIIGKFLKSHGKYNAGEVAGFDADMADALAKAGVFVPDAELTKAQGSIEAEAPAGGDGEVVAKAQEAVQKAEAEKAEAEDKAKKAEEDRDALQAELDALKAETEAGDKGAAKTAKAKA